MGENFKNLTVKDILKNHKGMVIAFIAGISACVMGAIVVAVFHINLSWVGRNGKASLGEFSFGTTFLFFALLILWETLFILIPGFLILGRLNNYWKNKLTDLEKHILNNDFNTGNSYTKQKKDGFGEYMGTIIGGFFVLLCFFSILIMLLIVILDGNWNTPYNTLPYTYYVNAWFAGLAWVSLACLIYVVFYTIIWYYRKKR